MKLLQLNLLPEAASQESEYALFSIVVMRLGVIFALIFMVLAVMLLPTFFDLSLQKADVLRALSAEEQNPAHRRGEEIDQKVSTANQRIRLLRNILAGERSRSQMLAAILTGAGSLHLDRVEFSRESRTFALAGRAERRDDIISFQHMLEALPAVEGVSSPFSNLIQETDVPFTLTVTIQP